MSKRPKTRMHHLAEALDHLHSSEVALQAIDLRQCRGELRERIKDCREQVAAAIEDATVAMRIDVPAVPKAVSNST